jgi:hypothetical protein
MDIITLQLSSLNSSYSSDYSAISSTYITNVGTFTATTTSYPTVSSYSPWNVASLSKASPGTGLWANSLSSIHFNFHDPFNDKTFVLPVSSFTTVTHTFGPPGKYIINMTVYPMTGSTSSYNVGYNIVQEISAQPIMQVFNTSNAFQTGQISGYSPLTLKFSASATIPGSYPIESLTWDFDDGSQTLVTQFEETTANNGMFFANVNDPRNYIVTHVFTRNNFSDPQTFTPRLSSTSEVTATIMAAPSAIKIYPLKLTQAGTRRLLKGRLFGFDNTLLLVSEDEGGHVFQHVVKLPVA